MVRTNIGYCVVAEFIIQREDKLQIENTLSIIKTWNSQWKPNYFMTDYSKAEISALESSFPDTIIYLCNFHQDQAWEWWVKASKHGLTGDELEILLDHLRAIAWAPSVGKEEDGNLPKYHHYNAAVTVLKSTNLWRNNSNVHQWLINNWLNIPEVCMCAVCTLQDCTVYREVYTERVHSVTILYVCCFVCECTYSRHLNNQTWNQDIMIQRCLEQKSSIV